jgi:hypothetical protein
MENVKLKETFIRTQFLRKVELENILSNLNNIIIGLFQENTNFR